MAEPVARTTAIPHLDSVRNGAVAQALPSEAEAVLGARFNGLIEAPQ